MIKLSIDPNSLKLLQDELALKVESIGMMTSPKYLDEVAKATFTLVGEKFMLATDRYAVQNPKKMHHIYEWGQIGNPKARLFVLQRSSILNGTVITAPRFLFSKSKVPINPELLIPGNSGKYVNRRSVFKNKAQVMENGIPITYIAQRNIVFMGQGGMIFRRPGEVIHIKNPGGIATKNAFSKFMLDWYNSNAQSIMNSSGLFERIANDASRVLNKDNATPSDVLKSMAIIANKVSGGKVEIR